MFAKRYFVFVLFSVLILMIAGCCLLPSPTPKTHIITATAGAGGTISPLAETTLTEGANQTFTITADTGYEISDVLVDGVSVGAVTTYTFTGIQQNHTIQAIFAEQAPPVPTITKYTITSSAEAGGSIDPEGSVKVKEGKSQSYTITPLFCYQIDDVLVDGASVGVVDTYTFTNVKKNHTIQAQFVSLGPKATNMNTGVDYDSIQNAIDESDPGDTIVVCPGTYEKIGFNNKNITVRSVDPLDPDIVAATIIDGGGVYPTTVVEFFGGDTSTLEGFTITNGNACSGGGIHMYQSSPTIKNNVITYNTTSGNGGGIFMDQSSPNITDNEITSNTAEDLGGGLFMSLGSPTISNNDITYNSADHCGGMYVSHSNLLPVDDRPTGWGTGEERVPSFGDPLIPAEGEEYFIAGNKFLGNRHGEPLVYSAHAHLSFDE